MRYQNFEIEPDPETVFLKYGDYEHYRRIHPDYHLFADLQERLPQYVRIINKLSTINLPPLNERGLPF